MKMKTGFLILAIVIGNSVYGQSTKSEKLTKEEMAEMTPDQRLVHETQRKQEKKRLSTKQRVKIQKKQARKSERIKQPKKPKRNRRSA